MTHKTLRHYYNRSVVFINGLRQSAGIGSIRKMILSKKNGWSGQTDRMRAYRDRVDSLKILENRLEKKDITETEYEIMKAMLTGKEENAEHHESANR